MDSHSRSASPRDQPRPQHRPPSPPPSPPPAGCDNQGYLHDDADPNHNDSFSSNSPHTNGHNKDLNGESKALEAVNLEMINMTPKNGNLKRGKDVEVDMNGSNPYDEYFVPVNEHRKYMRGEKLYVTADKRGEKSSSGKRPLCWTLLGLLVVAIVAVIVLAATGVLQITSKIESPYNSTLSEARAFGNVVHDHESNNDHVHEHDDEASQEHVASEAPSVEVQSAESNENTNTSIYIPRAVEGELKIDNQEFLDAYNDTESEAYREFTENFSNALKKAVFDRNVLEKGDQDIIINVIKLRPGSVLVTYRISWKPRFNVQPSEDFLTPTSLDSNLNSYLARNNRMISIYHIADDDMATRKVLDLCQVNKNGCESGCEFEESTLDFSCVCPSGQIINMHNPKSCIPYLESSETEPNETHVDDDNFKPKEFKVISIDSKEATEPMSEDTPNNVKQPQSNVLDWQEDHIETTTEQDSDLNFSHIIHSDSSESNEPRISNSEEPQPTPEPDPQQNIEPQVQEHGQVPQSESTQAVPMTQLEATVKPESTFQSDSVMESEQTSRPEPVAEPEPTSQPKPNIEPESTSQPAFSSLPDMTEPDVIPEPTSPSEPTTQAHNTTYREQESHIDTISQPDTTPVLISAPSTEHMMEIQTSTEQPQFVPVSPGNTFETKVPYSYESSSEQDSSMEAKPTEQSTDGLRTTPKIEYSPMLRFDTQNTGPVKEVLNTTEIYQNQSNEFTQKMTDKEIVSSTEPEPKFVEIAMTSSDIVSPATPRDEMSLNYKTPLHSDDSNLLNETSVEESAKEKTSDFAPNEHANYSNNFGINNETSTTTDNQFHTIYEQIPKDASLETVKSIEKNNETEKSVTNYQIPFITDSKQSNGTETDDDWLESPATDRKNVTEDIFDKMYMEDPNKLLSLLSETTTAAYNKMEENLFGLLTDNGESTTAKYAVSENKEIPLSENKETNNNFTKTTPILAEHNTINQMNNSKQINKTDTEKSVIPSFMGEAMLIGSKEVIETTIATITSVPVTDISTNKYENPLDEVLMEVYNHSIINETTTESNEKEEEDGTEVTFDDINTLYNRSSKAMQNNINSIVKDNVTSVTQEIDVNHMLTTDSDWITENSTETSYNMGMNKMNTFEATESNVSKLDILNSSNNKDDFEPDYLNNMGSSSNKMTDNEEPSYSIIHDYDNEDARVKRVKESKEFANTTIPKEGATEEHLVAPSRSPNSLSNITEKLDSNLLTSPPASTKVEQYQNNPDISNDIITPTNSSSNINASSNANSEQTVLTTSTTTIAPLTLNFNNSSNAATVIPERQNITDVNNLGVTIYEISSSNFSNNTYVLPNSTSIHSTEYEDHDIEMNPFLPETENNKSLVRKLQEGHDLEPSNLNETQNENIDEHITNIAENNVKYNESSLSFPKSLDSNDISSTVKTKVEEKPTISTFLIDTEDLDLNKKHIDIQNEIEHTTGIKSDGSKMSTADSSIYLNVVPILKEAGSSNGSYKMTSEE